MIDNPSSVLNDPLQRLLRLRAGGEVKRYHTFPTIGDQMVNSHSHNVFVLLITLNPTASRELLIASQYHDLAEYDTGDCPANVKWAFPNMAAMLRLAEINVEQQLGIEIFLSEEEENWLKLCDTLEYCLYALEQRRLGNQNMDLVFDRGMERLKSYPVAKFYNVDEFITSLKASYAHAKLGHSPQSLAISTSGVLDA